MDNEQFECLTKKIRVYGIVQGVGFRPLVYRLARKYGIKGTVRNIGGLVEIITHSSQRKLDEFLVELQSKNKESYDIVKIEIEDINLEELNLYFQDFRIIDSSEMDAISIIPPDLPVCSECQKELYSCDDRRFQNPFISCMSCGPRYTIMEDLPYDRINTTMKEFNMCPSCQEEYTSPESRRFHAQTISCNDCGPYLIYQDSNWNQTENRNQTENKNQTTNKYQTIHEEQFAKQNGVPQEEYDKAALDKAISILQSGGIVAMKGIGGFHLVCSPFMEDTVKNLRKLKGREEKPFAVMFPDIEVMKEYCSISTEEQELLESKATPIVLLYGLNKHMAPSTNKESIYIGAFLPYTPLQILLTRACGPLIMTSANISNQPIIKEDLKMLTLNSSYLKGVLYNKRRIVRSVDDSVAKILQGKPQLIRRSRGYVPYPIFIQNGNENIQVFSAGGDLKAAYCLYQDGKAVVSQYFGDLEERSILEEYEESFHDLSKLLKIKPDVAVCDLHPNYHSSNFAKKLGIPVIAVQHHHAHIASVLAEYNLTESVIGIAFDGTGYGIDGKIWGGEFLVCKGADYLRTAHLSYTPIIGGDQSMKDAKKTASCYLLHSGLMDYCIDERKDIIKAALDNKINTVMTSSMGRLFDAVAAILNIKEENSYEGECAILLEKAAFLALKDGQEPVKLNFAIYKKSDIIEIDSSPVLESLCKLRELRDIGALALGFHYAVAEMALNICEMIKLQDNISTVALGGGVFQNTILAEMVINLLQANGFTVYINRAVPPNDGSISLGQTFIGLMTASK